MIINAFQKVWSEIQMKLEIRILLPKFSEIEWFLFYLWYKLKVKNLINRIIIFLIHSNMFTHKKEQIKIITFLNENLKFSFEMHWKEPINKSIIMTNFNHYSNIIIIIAIC